MYDFQFSQLPSAYKPLLSTVQANIESIVACPGESTSMVIETLGYLPRKQVVIMEIPEVMNRAHYEHLAEAKKIGSVQVLNASGIIESSVATTLESHDGLAATQIVKRLIEATISPSLVFHYSVTCSKEGHCPEYGK